MATIDPRIVVWFSCGAASAVAAHEALKKYPAERVAVVYCDTSRNEHPDNMRFLTDVEDWLGITVERIASTKYATVEDVFDARSYMAGIAGAPCTVEMKKVPRFAYQRADDIHVFGFTADEQNRRERFDDNNPELNTDWVLIDAGITKDECLHRVDEAGISLPVLYGLGYNNNNCLGCVKATSARYWNMVRRDFPLVFEQRAKQSRKIGARLTRVKGVRVFLDELPADYLPSEPLEDISCGPDCNIQMALEVSDGE